MLKRFSNFRMNEMVENESEELKQFTENSLAYLMDDGLKVSIKNYSGFGNDNFSLRTGFSIILTTSTGFNLEWVNMKDDVIPFVTMLQEKYNVLKINIVSVDKRGMKTDTIKDVRTIMDDLERYESNKLLLQIVVIIEKKD